MYPWPPCLPRARLSILPILLFLLLPVPPPCLAYPEYFMLPKECDRKLAPGELIMGLAALPEPMKDLIIVMRGEKQLVSGEEYREGETLHVKFRAQAPFIINIEGPGNVADGACDGHRISRASTLAMPVGDGLEEVRLVAGFASELSYVSVTPPFVLRAPGTGAKLDPPEEVEEIVDLPAEKLLYSKKIDKKKVVELSWSPDPAGQYVDVQVAAMGVGWVAFGLIEGPPVMVYPDKPHHVHFYPDKDGDVTHYKLSTVFPSQFPILEADPSVEVLIKESTGQRTRLRYRIHAGKGGAGDILNLNGKNRILWAHGIGAFPLIHDETGNLQVEWMPPAHSLPPELERPSRESAEQVVAIKAPAAGGLKHSLFVDEDKNVMLSHQADPGGKYVDLEIQGKGMAWVAVGLIRGEHKMVVKGPKHVPILYPDEEGKPIAVELKAQDPEGLGRKPLDPSIEVFQSESNGGSTTLRYRIHIGKGGIGDAMLNVDGSNDLIWAASDEAFPGMHVSDGFVRLTWGTEGAITIGSETAFPLSSMYMLLLPLLGLPFMFAPIRRSLLGHTLLQKRLFKTPRDGLLTSILGRDTVDAVSYTLDAFSMILIYLGLHIFFMLYWVADYGNAGQETRRAWTLATGLGSLTNVMMVLLPISKTSLWVRILGIGYERALKFHRLLARYTIALMAVHLGLSLCRPIAFTEDSSTRGVVSAFGLVAFSLFVFVALTAMEMVRRRLFELFKWLHYLVWVAVIMIILHLPLSSLQPAYTFVLTYLAVPVLLYAIDLMLRWGYAYMPASVLSLKALPGGVTELTLSIHWLVDQWQEGSFYLINIPAVSGFEWHPFSACGDSTPGRLSFRIKSLEGNTWTGRLRELAKSSSSNGGTSLETLGVHVDGPYGHLSISPQDYRDLILVGGGVGITSLTSTLAMVQRRADRGALPLLENITLVWVVRSVEQLSWFETFLTGFQQPATTTAVVVVDEGQVVGVKKSSKGQEDESKHQEVEGGSTPSQSSSPRNSTVAYNFRLFVTSVKEAGVTESGLQYSAGRPVMRDVVRQVVQERGRARSVGMVACCPRDMLVNVRNAAVEAGVDLHEEVFGW